MQYSGVDRFPLQSSGPRDIATSPFTQRKQWISDVRWQKLLSFTEMQGVVTCGNLSRDEHPLVLF